ncbi:MULTISPECIES: hypothetical protein [Geobacillus]|uniref:hypothetical protein n=1 Tax=Geobacillus TaxID=129337 RepID=UPI0009BDCE66|nr:MULTISPECIES: hypothetical protein [Geobacillus]ATO37586.1 hypothetical protein GTID1_10530 [Geobacillus thermodenitrificans]QNU29805.1 hypothetical protein IC804_09330 [Geobacillus sp. 47C-IIb]
MERTVSRMREKQAKKVSQQRGTPFSMFGGEVFSTFSRIVRSIPSHFYSIIFRYAAVNGDEIRGIRFGYVIIIIKKRMKNKELAANDERIVAATKMASD